MHSMTNKTMVLKSTFLRVLNTARTAGALLPEEEDLNALATRLQISAAETRKKEGDMKAAVTSTHVDVLRWALLYPGDAMEVLRWSCLMASAVDMNASM